jgi:metal-sulfur cluster biosynthetic enzyme
LTGEQSVPAQVTAALKEVIDPEIGVNIVDLGLLYGVRIDDHGVIQVDMTLTSQGCPDADSLRDQVYQALSALDLGSGICVNWVWKPAWGPQHITPDGRDQLRALGFHV